MKNQNNEAPMFIAHFGRDLLVSFVTRTNAPTCHGVIEMDGDGGGWIYWDLFQPSVGDRVVSTPSGKVVGILPKNESDTPAADRFSMRTGIRISYSDHYVVMNVDNHAVRREDERSFDTAPNWSVFIPYAFTDDNNMSAAVGDMVELRTVRDKNGNPHRSLKILKNPRHDPASTESICDAAVADAMRVPGAKRLRGQGEVVVSNGRHSSQVRLEVRRYRLLGGLNLWLDPGEAESVARDLILAAAVADKRTFSVKVFIGNKEFRLQGERVSTIRDVEELDDYGTLKVEPSIARSGVHYTKQEICEAIGKSESDVDIFWKPIDKAQNRQWSGRRDLFLGAVVCDGDIFDVAVNLRERVLEATDEATDGVGVSPAVGKAAPRPGAVAGAEPRRAATPDAKGGE